MSAFFPELLPEELLYSAVARYRDRMRFPNERMVLKLLFGRSTHTAVVDLTGYVDALLARLPPMHRYTAASVVRRHTTLPFYLRFVAPTRAAEAETRLCSGSSTGVNDLLGLRASTVPTPTHLHFCPLCAEADVETCGEPYWRRAHQLPGVWICSVHGEPLWQSGVQRTNVQGRQVFRSLASAEPADATPLVPPPGRADVLARLAADTDWLLQAEPAVEGLQAISARYRAHLHAQGWTRGARQIRMGELRNAIRCRFGARLLQALGCSLGTGAVEDDWLARLLRKPRAAQHPLHHLLVIQFLGLTAETFFSTAPVAERSADMDTGVACFNPTCPRDGRGPAQCTRAAAGVWRCERCGLVFQQSASKVRVLARGAVWEGRLRGLVADASISLRRASALLGVDAVTLKRHAQRLGVWRDGWGRGAVVAPPPNVLRVGEASSRHRHLWLRMRSDHPEEGTSDLRRRAPATYAHLYRRDRGWLEANQPPRVRPAVQKPRVDWCARDAELRALAETTVERILADPGRPIRLRVTTVARRMEYLALVEQHRDRLPLTSKYLDQVVESRSAHARRKIAWVAKQYIRERVVPAEWEFIRRAALRPHLAAVLTTEISEALGLIRTTASPLARAS
jgi:ribosomal protein L37AE/L43A